MDRTVQRRGSGEQLTAWDLDSPESRERLGNETSIFLTNVIRVEVLNCCWGLPFLRLPKIVEEYRLLSVRISCQYGGVD